MKKIAWILAAILALSLCLMGCDKKDDVTENPGSAGNAVQTTEAPAAKLTGTTESWGAYAEVFVPDGMKLTGGSQIDKEDQNSMWVQKSDNALNYFLFVISTEEQCQKDVAATKEYNKDSDKVTEMKDVSVQTGAYTWTGVSYLYETYSGPSPVVQMYAVIGDKAVNVRMAGFAYDSDVTKAILESLKLN
jgi:hypothetical protein